MTLAQCCRLLALGLSWALSAIGPHAAAQSSAATVYRCGDNQYSQQPCPGGRLLPVDEPPSAEARRQAREVARSEQALAATLRAQRLAQERAAARQGAAGFDTAASAAPAKRPPKNNGHKGLRKHDRAPDGGARHPRRESLTRTDPAARERLVNGPAPARPPRPDRPASSNLR